MRPYANFIIVDVPDAAGTSKFRFRTELESCRFVRSAADVTSAVIDFRGSCFSATIPLAGEPRIRQCGNSFHVSNERCFQTGLLHASCGADARTEFLFSHDPYELHLCAELCAAAVLDRSGITHHEGHEVGEEYFFSSCSS